MKLLDSRYRTPSPRVATAQQDGGHEDPANKYAVNPVLDKLGIKPLPVMSALQMNAAIDQRQGMRVFLAEYGLSNQSSWPRSTEVPFKERQAMVMRSLMRC